LVWIAAPATETFPHEFDTGIATYRYQVPGSFFNKTKFKKRKKENDPRSKN
jgi:hypothetical protein